MPNHVSHHCIITGPESEVSRFADKMICKSEKGHDTFDFNQIIPMPELLRNTESSSIVMDGLALLGYESSFGMRKPVFVGKEKTLGDFLERTWVKKAGITTIDELEKELIKTRPDCVQRAQRALEVLQKYGHTDWYSWSIENWGTKWNSYGFDLLSKTANEIEFRFETAWSFPAPIFDALAKEFPELNIDVAGFDEGHCFCVIAQYGSGINVVKYNEEKCDPENDPFSAGIYERAYGYSYEPYEEE